MQEPEGAHSYFEGTTEKKCSLLEESFSEDNDKHFTCLPTYGIMMVAFQVIRLDLNLNMKLSPFQQFLLTCVFK